MGTEWAEISDDPIGSKNDNDERRERDSEKWGMPADDSTDLQNFAQQVGAPEDLRLFPQELELFPQEVNADCNEWSVIEIGLEQFYWNPVDDPS